MPDKNQWGSVSEQQGSSPDASMFHMRGHYLYCTALFILYALFLHYFYCNLCNSTRELNCRKNCKTWHKGTRCNINVSHEGTLFPLHCTISTALSAILYYFHYLPSTLFLLSALFLLHSLLYCLQYHIDISVSYEVTLFLLYALFLHTAKHSTT